MGQTVFKHYLLALSSFVSNAVKNKSHGETEKKKPKSHNSDKASILRNQAAL